jgi:sRNA-binding protein
MALVAGADRVGLDGLPAGTVTEAEAQDAAEKLRIMDELSAEFAIQARQAFMASRLTQNSGGTVEADAANSAITAEAPGQNTEGNTGAPKRLSLADLKAAARLRRTA